MVCIKSRQGLTRRQTERYRAERIPKGKPITRANSEAVITRARVAIISFQSWRESTRLRPRSTKSAKPPLTLQRPIAATLQASNQAGGLSRSISVKETTARTETLITSKAP